MKEPAKIRTKYNTEWLESLADYPADAYTLKYDLSNASENITITSTASGTDHKISTTPNIFGQSTGNFHYNAYVVRISDQAKYFLYEGWIELEGDYKLSHARKVLDGINAAIERRATKEQDEISIDGRMIKYMSLDALFKAKTRYEGIVAQEVRQAKIDRGEQPGNRFLLSFGRHN